MAVLGGHGGAWPSMGRILEGRAPRVRVSAGATACCERADLVKLYGWLCSAAMAEHGPP